MSVSAAFLRLAVLIALFGIGLGIFMAFSGQFELVSVHAHINLLGWVSMFLYGLFYRSFPTAERGWLGRAHFGFSTIGFLLFVPTLTAIKLAGPSLPSVLGGAIAALLVLIGAVLFTVVVFRHTGREATPT
ncbi:hypothetical protein [Brevundimonas sp.]|uniref:hypothetical protein n=1 Tax=Brevundimonas sp. TaxID=1871086 RepID=UPI0025B96361|nr:hypothetical protein [Brevundimonas sp.]